MKNTLGTSTYNIGDGSSISATSTTLSTGLQNFTFAEPLYIEKGYMPVFDYTGGQTSKIAVDTSGSAAYSDYSYSISLFVYVNNQKLNSGSNYRFYFKLLVRELTSKEF